MIYMLSNNLFARLRKITAFIPILIALFFIGDTLNAQSDIVWTDLVGGTVASGNDITKTGGAAAWDGGAASTNILAAGTDGYFEATAGEQTQRKMFGISSSNGGASHTTIGYAVYMRHDRRVYLFENGASKGRFGSYVAGDVFRIERTGTTIEYKKNGTTFYTSTIASSSQLIADISIYSNGAMLNDVKIFTASCDTDADMDNVCADVDCDDNDSSVGASQAEGTACDDGDANTEDDQIQADGCTCAGTAISGGGSSFFAADGETGDIIYSGGKVIVGTSGTNKPGNYKLYVEGGILTELAKVAIRNEASWSDYVFANDYDLKKIEEVAQFINQNKHLPNVPSAAEVVDQGIDVAQMDATLLRQIEELWLHMIELKKENKMLHQKIEHLEVQNEK